MIVSPQDKCLECDYSLEGLPGPHRCPECGVAYDDVTTIFRPKIRWKNYIPHFGVLFYVVYLVGSNWRMFVAWLGVWGAVVAVAAFFALLVLRTVRLVRRLQERPCQAALTRDALVVRTQGQRIVRLPYDEIAFVSVVDTHPWVQRKQGRGRGAHLRPTEQTDLRGIFQRDSEMKAFKRMVDERIERGSAGECRITGENALTAPSVERIHVDTQHSEPIPGPAVGESRGRGD